MSKWEDEVWNRLCDKVHRGPPQDATITNEILLNILGTLSHIKRSLKTLEWVIGIVAILWLYKWIVPII